VSMSDPVRGGGGGAGADRVSSLFHGDGLEGDESAEDVALDKVRWKG
jgi:hypothetical protein